MPHQPLVPTSIHVAPNGPTSSSAFSTDLPRQDEVAHPLPGFQRTTESSGGPPLPVIPTERRAEPPQGRHDLLVGDVLISRSSFSPRLPPQEVEHRLTDPVIGSSQGKEPSDPPILPVVATETRVGQPQGRHDLLVREVAISKSSSSPGLPPQGEVEHRSTDLATGSQRATETASEFLPLGVATRVGVGLAPGRDDLLRQTVPTSANPPSDGQPQLRVGASAPVGHDLLAPEIPILSGSPIAASPLQLIATPIHVRTTRPQDDFVGRNSPTSRGLSWDVASQPSQFISAPGREGSPGRVEQGYSSPSPAGMQVSETNGIDLGAVAEKVSRIIARQHRMERERRGKAK